MDGWMMFEWHAKLEVEQSIDFCDWYSARLLRNTLQEGRTTHNPAWENRWECPVLMDLWDAVPEAYENHSLARIVSFNASHKLTPLDQ